MMKEFKIMESIIDKQFNNGGLIALNQGDIDNLLEAYHSYVKWLCKYAWDEICIGNCKVECRTLTWINNVKENRFIQSRSLKLDLSEAEINIVHNARTLLIDIINACGRGVCDHISIEHNLFTEDGVLDYTSNFKEVIKDFNVKAQGLNTYLSRDGKNIILYVQTIEDNINVSEYLKGAE